MYIVPNWLFAIIIYTFIILIIFLTKPSVFFTKEGKVKSLGVGFKDGKSVFALPLALPILALLSYYISITIKLGLSA
jgi:hypothetical protein